MKNTPSTFLLLLLTLFVSSTMLHAQEWQLKRDKGGIKVYVRDQAGTAIKELKFTTTVEASMQTIAAVLTHVEGFDDWVYASLKSRTIKQVSEGEVYYYTLIDFPWPLSNRDLVLHSKVWQDKKTLAIFSKTTSCHWMETEKEDVVRIKKAELIWIFTPLGSGKVRVDYTLNSDPGGSIPAWMINLAADQGPLQSMIKFQEMLEREKYKNSRLAFVTNAK